MALRTVRVPPFTAGSRRSIRTVCTLIVLLLAATLVPLRQAPADPTDSFPSALQGTLTLDYSEGQDPATIQGQNGQGARITVSWQGTIAGGGSQNNGDGGSAEQGDHHLAGPAIRPLTISS